MFNGNDLGGTMKNVKISVTTKKAPMKIDQLGETEVDHVWSGFEVKIETVLAEIKNKATFKAALPSGLKIAAGNGAMYFQSQIGQRDSDLAAVLLLHPLSQADGSLDFDHTFYKAVPEEVTEIVFGPTEQQGLKVVWKVLPDTGVVPARFWFHGDPANGLVAADSGSPSYSGTGDGTISNVAVYNGFTKTETITIKCVGVPGSNQSNWVISGSVSGPLGELELAGGSGDHADFTSPVISFTITDGGTDFVIGDTWTIGTSAANYA
jgi:hypothetical protein